MKIQTDYLKEILKLKKEDPKREIIFVVDSASFAEDGAGITQKIYFVDVEDWYGGEEVLTDESQIREQIRWDAPNDLLDDDIEGYIDEVYAEKVVKVIAVRMGE